MHFVLEYAAGTQEVDLRRGIRRLGGSGRRGGESGGGGGTWVIHIGWGPLKWGWNV